MNKFKQKINSSEKKKNYERQKKKKFAESKKFEARQIRNQKKRSSKPKGAGVEGGGGTGKMAGKFVRKFLLGMSEL